MWRRTSSFSSEPSLNCTELPIINESIHPIIFTGNTNNIHNHSYDSLNDEEEEKIKLPIFKTSQLRLLNRFRNYRIPASYSVRSTSNVNCNFNCGTKHKMKKEKHLCCQTKNCEAEYLTTSCSVINKWKVFLVKPHDHMVLSEYHNIDRGFDEWFKPKINEFLKKRITAPNYINTELLNVFIQNISCSLLLYLFIFY